MTNLTATFMARGVLAVSFCLLLSITSEPAHSQQPLVGFEVAAEQGELLIDGKPVRLYGIHFPSEPGVCSEAVHGCRDLGLKALADWLASVGQVECDVLTVTSSGTHIARCRQDQIDLGAWLIGHGFALADRRGGRGYLRDEQAARGDSAGLWSEGDIVAQF